MKPLHEMSFDEQVDLANRREWNRRHGRPLDAPIDAPTIGPLCEAKNGAQLLDDERLEKEIELRGDKQLRALGFEVVKFSHPGRTKQTPGIPDRRYYHRARRLALWWEAKSATGRQRPDQKYFEEMCTAVGETYLLGTDDVLFAWLVAQKIAFEHEGLLVALPVTPWCAPVGPAPGDTACDSPPASSRTP